MHYMAGITGITGIAVITGTAGITDITGITGITEVVLELDTLFVWFFMMKVIVHSFTDGRNTIG